MRRIATWALACALAWGGPVPTATGHPSPVHRAPADDRTPVAESDFTGVGTRAWRSPFFSDEGWLDRREPGAQCGMFAPECAWYYNRYRLNCLAPDSPGPAYQVLWVYPDTVALTETVLMQRPWAVLSQIRATASVFAASNRSGFTPTHLAQKARDRSPRFATFEYDGRCEAFVYPVAVPLDVLRRAPLQNRHRPKDGKAGLLPWLEAQGFDRPNRRYVAIVDFTALGLGPLASAWLLRVGGSTTAAASINLQNPGILWGPYGRGQARDVDTSPGPENFCNRGGVMAYVNLWPSTARDLLSQHTDGLARVLAHEIGHTLCQNALAPHISGTSMHLRDREDILGDTNVIANQCGPILDQPQWTSRFDCAHDDYWGQTSLDSKAAWTSERWDSSDSEYLWGAPQSRTQTEHFSLRALDLTCVALDYCYD